MRGALFKLASGTTELEVPKNNHGRVVGSPSESLEASKPHRERNRDTSGNGNFVFSHSDGSALDPDLVTQAFERLAKRGSLPGLRLHDLHHTHTSMMLSQGIHPKIVSERLGHSSIAITIDSYSHLLPMAQEESESHFGPSGRKGMAKEWQIQTKTDKILSVLNTGVDGARWPLRSSKPLCLVRSGVGGFDSLALPPL